MIDDFEDCACTHGVDCFDYMGTCVYCGFQLTEEQMKERRIEDKLPEELE